jgi:Domain of unknown function (DUF4160)
MPTIFRIRRFRVEIFTLDHRPSHVHVTGPDRRASFDLNCPDGPVRLRSQRGCRKAQIDSFAAAIEARLGELCQEWERIHGDV